MNFKRKQIWDWENQCNDQAVSLSTELRSATHILGSWGYNSFGGSKDEKMRFYKIMTRQHYLLKVDFYGMDECKGFDIVFYIDAFIGPDLLANYVNAPHWKKDVVRIYNEIDYYKEWPLSPPKDKENTQRKPQSYFV